jgi:hypothetical protein
MSKPKLNLVNLLTVLALLIFLVPQQYIAAVPLKSEASPNVPHDGETYFPEMIAGPEKEPLDETQLANSRVLSIAGWHFKAYFDPCLDKFRNDAFGRVGPRSDLTLDCYITVPLLLPSGTKITRVVLNYYDDSDKDLNLGIFRFQDDGSRTIGDSIVNLSSQLKPGYDFQQALIDHII